MHVIRRERSIPRKINEIEIVEDPESSLSLVRFVFFYHFCKGNNFCDFLFASLAVETFQKNGFTLKGKNLLLGQQFFPFKNLPPSRKDAKIENVGVVSHFYSLA